MKNLKIGYAMCGSFCTLSSAVDGMEELVRLGADVCPVMSQTVYSTDTRFGPAADFIARIEGVCGRGIIHEIPTAEPIGPKKMLDLMIVSPCTGNTLGKLACGITDTPVTLAVKAHLRNRRPVLLAVATNDALAASGTNIGRLLNTKNVFFVPMYQDDPFDKTTSLIADFSLIPEAARAAIEGRQLEPLLIERPRTV